MKYSKLLEVTDSKVISEMDALGYTAEDVPFIVTEKLKGKHMTITYDVSDASIRFETNAAYDSYSDDATTLRQSLHRIVKSFEKKPNKTLTVHGVLVGPNLQDESQRQIRYGFFQKFYVIDINVDGHYICQGESLILAGAAGFQPVPVIGVFQNFQLAVESPQVFESVVLKADDGEPVKGNYAAGGVIQPLAHMLRLKDHTRVIFNHSHPQSLVKESTQ